MKENEKRLFKVLIFVIIAVIVYLVLFFNITEIQESRKSIEKYSKSIQNFKSTEKNEVVLEVTLKFYFKGENYEFFC